MPDCFLQLSQNIPAAAVSAAPQKGLAERVTHTPGASKLEAFVPFTACIVLPVSLALYVGIYSNRCLILENYNVTDKTDRSVFYHSLYMQLKFARKEDGGGKSSQSQARLLLATFLLLKKRV